MTNLIFIKARVGLTTSEILLQVINQNPNELTLKQLSNSINRPVSMINICLKQLSSAVQLMRIQRLIYPRG